MKHSKYISRTILTSFYVLATLSCSKNQLDGKQIRESNTKKDTQILYSRAHLPDKPLKLKDIINVAFKRNLNLLAYEQEYLMEKDTAIRSQLAKLPQANVTGEMQHRFNRSGSLSSTGGITSNSFSSSTPRNTRKADVQYLFNLLDFGVTHFRFRQAKNRFHILAQKHKRLKQNLLLDLTTAYWQAVISQKATEGAEIILALTEKRQRDIQKQVKHKLVSEIEGLENQRRLLETQLRLKSYKKELENSKAQLLQLMGLPPSTEFDLAYEEIKIRQPEDIDVKKLEELSLLYRPELFTSDLEEKVDADEVRASILSMFPNISVIGGHFYDENPLLENNYWNTVGSRALWNILSVPANEKNFHIARHKQHLTQANRLNTSIGIISQVHLAHLEFKDAWEQHKLAKSLFDTKERLLEVGRLEQKQGVFDAADILELESESLFAEIFSNTTHAELNIALARMGNAIGDPLAFVEVNLDSLDLTYKDMVNFDVTQRVAEQWAYAKSSYEEEYEYEDAFVEVAISEEEQNRRQQLLASAQNREYFESTLPTLTPEQLKHTIQYTTMFTKDGKAKERVQKLATPQLLGLKKESFKAFNDLVPHLEAIQIKELLIADNTVLGPTDISHLQAPQLIELYRIDSSFLDQMIPQITPIQLAALMHSEHFTQIPGALDKVRKLSQDQLELVYSVDAKLFRKIVAVLSGEQLQGLIGRETNTRGMVAKWSQNNLPGIIDSDASLVNLLESSQLEYLAVHAPEKFQRIDHQLSVDQIRGLIRETSLFDSGTPTSELLAKVPEHLLFEMFSKDAIAFEKVIPLLSSNQLDFFIQQGNVFNANERASDRTSRLAVSQIVHLKQNHPKSFEDITENFSGHQLLEIFAKGDYEKRSELVKVLSHKQILEIHQSDKDLFSSILGYFDKDQLVDLMYNSPTFIQDPLAPQYVQSLTAHQLDSLKEASYVVFSTLLPHMTEFQILDLIKSDGSVLARTLTPQQEKGQKAELLAHFVSPSQLQALFYLDQDSFGKVVGSLNAFQLDALLIINPQMFHENLVANISIERLLELQEIKNSHLALIIPKASVQQVGSLIASLPLEEQQWVENIPASSLKALSSQEILIHKLLPFLKGKQLASLIEVETIPTWLETKEGLVATLSPSNLEELHKENPEKLNVLMGQLSKEQLIALIDTTSVFDQGSKKRFEKVSFQTIFEIYHSNTKAFKKILPQLAISQVKNLFDDASYIDEYVTLFTPDQIYDLMKQYPGYIQKVVDKLSVHQLVSLLSDSELEPLEGFINQLSSENLEKLTALSPQSFVNLSGYLSAEKLLQLITGSQIFQQKEASLSLAGNISSKILMQVEGQNPQAFDQLLPHLSLKQVLALSSDQSGILGSMNPQDKEDNNERWQLLTQQQVSELSKQDNFSQYLPFLSSVQVQDLHYNQPAIFRNEQYVKVITQEQLLELTRGDITVLSSFSDLLTINQVLNTLVHAPKEGNRQWVDRLKIAQVKNIYQRDKKTFKTVLPLLNVEHIDALLSQTDKQKGWFKKKGRQEETTILDANESLLQLLTYRQIEQLDTVQAEKVEAILPYLSKKQLNELLDKTQVMGKNEGQRVKNLPFDFIVEMHQNHKGVFDKVFTLLSTAQVKGLFEKQEESRSYVNKMTYPQLSAYSREYPQEFISLLPLMEVDQFLLLMETQELQPSRTWVSSLALSQLKEMAGKDKLTAVLPYLSLYQFEDLVLNTSLLTQDSEAAYRVPELLSSQIIQLNEKNPGAIDMLLAHVSLDQMQQLAAKEPDFLTDHRIKSLSSKQLQVINSKEIQDSEEVISRLNNDQLVALIQKEQFFKIDKEENKERIRALQHGHLSHISKFQPKFLERIIKDLDFDQLKHLIVTTSFLTHDHQALERMNLLGTEQIIDLYRKLNFFKEGKRAQALLNELQKDQLVDIALKDSTTFDALFNSFNQAQLISLLDDPQKIVREKHIQQLNPSILIGLAEQKVASMSYPPKTYFDQVLKHLNASQLQHLVQYTDLLTEKFGDHVRFHYLSVKQLKGYYEINPSGFKDAVSMLSLKQLSSLVDKTSLFTQESHSKELVESLTTTQLKHLKESYKPLAQSLLRHLSLSQLDQLYPFSQTGSKAGSWVRYLSLGQVDAMGKVAPEFVTQVLPYLTSGQILQLMESTSLFQNPTYSSRYIQSLSFQQIKEISEANESYFQQVITQLSNEQVNQLMDMKVVSKGSSKGFFARLFSSTPKSKSRSSEAIINDGQQRVQYLSLNQLDYIFKTDRQKFWEILPNLNTYQLSEIIGDSLFFKDQPSATAFTHALSDMQLEELIQENPQGFRSLIVYLNGEQLSQLIGSSQLFSQSSYSKEMIERLMLSQLEEVQKVSGKAFSTLLRYLSISQLSEVIDKTTLLTEDSQAAFYLQYLSSHQVLKLRDQESKSFSKLIKVMDTRQIVNLIDMPNTPLTPQFLQVLSLKQLEGLSVGEVESFEKIFANLSTSQLHAFIMYSEVFDSLNKGALIQSLPSGSINQLGHDSSKAFEKILPYLNGPQIATLIYVTQEAKKSFIGKVLDQVTERKMRGIIGADLNLIQRLTALQLQQLFQVNPQKFDSIASGFSEDQIATLIESKTLYEGQEGIKRFEDLYPHQLKKLAEKHPKVLASIIERMSGKQVDAMNRETLLLSNHIHSSVFVNALRVSQLRELSNQYPQTFDALLKNIDKEVVNRLIQDSDTDFTPYFVHSLSYEQLNNMHQYNAQSFIKAFGYFNINQIAEFIQNSDILTKDSQAAEKVALLTLGQLQELNAINPRLFDAIISNLSGSQLEGIVKSNTRLLTQERVKRLTEKQLSELRILPNEFKRISQVGANE